MNTEKLHSVNFECALTCFLQYEDENIPDINNAFKIKW